MHWQETREIVGVYGYQWQEAAMTQQQGARYYRCLRALGTSREQAALWVERWRRSQQQQ